MMYITHMLLVWQYFYLKLTIRDNGSSIWNHGTTINFGLSGIMVLLFHMVLLMIGAKIHYGTCIPYTPSIQDLRVVLSELHAGGTTRACLVIVIECPAITSVYVDHSPKATKQGCAFFSWLQ